MAEQRRKGKGANSTESFTDTRVGVYNIFITTDAELAENFSKYSSYSILKSDLDRSQHDTVRALGKDSFGDKNRHRIKSADKRALCLLTSDINLIDFTHEFNFSEGKTTAPIIKLKCLEHGMQVLKKFYYLLLGERMSEVKYRKNELLEQSKKLDSLSLPGQWLGKHVGQSHIDTLEVEGEVNQYIRDNVNGQRVFIAYGIGDDLKYWGGPYSCILGQLEHDNDGKTESITYHFSPDHISRQFDENPKDLGMDTVNFKSISIPISAYNETEGSGEGRQLVKFSGFTPSLHDNVVKLISNYLYQLGIKNHLIVLPNLDYLLSPIAANVLLHDHDAIGDKRNPWAASINDSLTSLNDDTNVNAVKIATAFLQDIAYQNQRIFGVETEGVKWRHRKSGVEGGEVARRGLSKGTARAVVQMQKDYISKIGLRCNGIERESSEVDPRLIGGANDEKSISASWEQYQEENAWYKPDWFTDMTRGGVGSEKLFGLTSFLEYAATTKAFGALAGEDYREEIAKKAFELLELQRISINDPFGSSKFGSTADSILSLELPFEADADALGVKRAELIKDNNFIEHVEKFLQQIVNKSGGFVGRLTSFWENEVSMINLLKNKFGSGTFIGYKDNIKRQYTAGALSNNLGGSNLDISDDSFFIFGDHDLIRDFVYGEINNKLIGTPESRSVIFQLRRGVPSTLGQNPNGYFLDPFWGRLRGDLITSFNENSIAAIANSSIGKGKQSRSAEANYKASIGGTYFTQAQKLKRRSISPTPFGFFTDVNTGNLASMLSNEFAFLNKDENRGALDDIYELGMPFFLANTKSANVQSYTFDADNFIFTQFLGSINEIYYNVAYRFVKLGQKNPILQGKLSSDATFDKIYSILDQIRSRGGAYGAAYQRLGFSTPDLNLTKLSTDLTDIMLQETVGLHRTVRKNYGADTLAICALFLSLFESQFKGIIKTLPMFHLSTQSSILKPAIVSLKSTPGLNAKPSSDLSTADFFSGLYKILGFKHTITSKKGESEFTLIKDVHSSLSNE